MNQPVRKALVNAGPTLRILLTEDNQINQRLAIQLLEKRGHHVTLAQNGIEAVALSEAEHLI